LIGTAVGFVTGSHWMQNKNAEEKNHLNYYGFYVDYGNYQTTELQNGWISGEVPYSKPLDALKSMADIVVSSNGELVSINGVEPDADHLGETWIIWLLPGYGFPPPKWIESGTTLNDLSMMYIFYLGVASRDPVTNTPSIDPNSTPDCWYAPGNPYETNL